MTRDEMLAELRLVIDDTMPDYGWPDVTLLGYLSEGQDKFCEETGYFTDLETYTITTAAGTAMYAVPDRVISIKDIFYGSYRLNQVQQEDLWLPSQRRVGAYQTMLVTDSDQRALPHTWSADFAAGYIRLFPIPDAIYTLQLRVWRYSLYDLAGEDALGAAAQPEIPSRFQRACIEWAAFKALSHHDAEQQDPVKANDHFQIFQQYVRDGRKALSRLTSAIYEITPNRTYVG